MSTFSDWAEADNPRVVLCHLQASDGTDIQDLYVGSEYYLDDTTEYLDRLREPLIIRRSLNGAFTGLGEASVGSIVMDNRDRELNDWFGYFWEGHDITLLIGDPSWDIGEFKTLFSGVADRVEIDDFNLTVFTKDLNFKLNQPVVERPLNANENAFLEPWPICFGAAKNVSPPIGITVDDRYIVGTWDSATSDTLSDLVSEVYENGVPSPKSITPSFSFGGVNNAFRFNVDDPQGRVTCDPVGATDDPQDGSTTLSTAGEILKKALTYTLHIESGIAKGGSTTTIVLDGNASDEDDYYNGDGSGTLQVGEIQIIKRDNSSIDIVNIDDYDGATRTATLDTTLGSAVEEGDLYFIAPPEFVQHSPLTEADLDTDSFDNLDTEAPYPLGIWIRGGSMTFQDLLDNILPSGFWYAWTRESKLSVGLLEEPSGTPDLTIDNYETHGQIRRTKDGRATYRTRVGYDRNYTVMQSPDESADKERVAFLGREYLWEISEDLDIRTRNPNAKAQEFTSFITNRADAKTEAERLLDLFGTQRERVLLETFAAPLSIDLHDVVRVKDDDFGWTDGEDFRVVGITEHPLQDRIELELWG